ncbi:hypothetical protein Zmor_006410 [Zophobas morio]|uniref:Uncharacterized protein n=1 Tax=Zophobas morio TaxID=2755281 RepID=A0AA38IUV1_9CUCU|nr:hypothetical protein Zmor_006410 [Zophobas morio]
MTALPVIFTYYSQHLCYQVMMLSKHIRTLGDPVQRSEEDLEKLIYDENYQNEFHRKIVFCIRRKLEFTTYAQKTLGLAEAYVLPYQVIGTVVTARIVVLCFARTKSVRYGELRIVVLFQIPDLQWQDFFDAVREVSWYHWNITNKKIYLILLTNSSRVYKIKYTENISLNHKLGLQVIRAVLSAISLTCNSQNKMLLHSND